MMDFFERLRQGRSEAIEAKRARKELAAHMRAQMGVQVTEYNGKLYISFDGVPVVEESMLAEPQKIVEILSTIRATVVSFHRDEDERMKTLGMQRR